ncbi:Prophage CP4-57 integrase [compost metagenome]
MQLRTRGARYLLVHRYEPEEMISENTLNTAISRMGFKGRLTGHGIRATISTALNEVGFVEEWIEAQLSHADANQIRAAYNHAEYVEPRRRMMQYWADLLEALEAGVPLPVPEAYMPQIGGPSTDFLSMKRVPAD